jgi:transcriptional regulator with XRE-family HTH domain
MKTKRFTNTLRGHRTRIGLRQIDVAKLLKLDCADRLSRWENGLSGPNIVNLFKLSALYKVPPQELYPDLYQALQPNPQGERIEPIIEDESGAQIRAEDNSEAVLH